MSVGNKPPWLRVRHTVTDGISQTRKLNRQLNLHTVCDSAHCPNIGECWAGKHSTFMILGDICTRDCHFCAVHPGRPNIIDDDEPNRVAEAVVRSGLRYVVITSVTRDDLDDGGASVFSSTVNAIRSMSPDCGIELLISDFKGEARALNTVIGSKPEVIGHNIEVVKRLQGTVRDSMASYPLSLRVLESIKVQSPGQITKSSLMLGLGETEDEVIESMRDLRDVDVDILTLGQYLRPGPNQVPVTRYVPPEEFDHYRLKALRMGFKAVMAGPFVRSSYKAHEAYQLARGE